MERDRGAKDIRPTTEVLLVLLMRPLLQRSGGDGGFNYDDGAAAAASTTTATDVATTDITLPIPAAPLTPKIIAKHGPELYPKPHSMGFRS